MKKIGIVFGGDSLEHDISIVTGQFVIEECKKNGIPYLPIYIAKNGGFYSGKAVEDRLNYQKKKGFKKLKFVLDGGVYYAKCGSKKHILECVILCVHGKNVEDGTVGAFFDLLKIPCSYSGVSNSSLLQDKELTKIMCNKYKIPVINCQCIRKQEELKGKIKYPCIVKPAHLGSSIGVYKVENKNELKDKIDEILSYDNKVIIEDVVKNLHEYNIAALGDSDEIILSAIEEVNKEDKVLGFADKYEQFKGESDSRTIPAKIDEELKNTIEEYTKRAFINLECRGVVRFDYLYDEEKNKVYLNEINAIPGSLAFYLFEEVGISFHQLIIKLKELSLKSYQNKRHLLSDYSSSNLLKIGRKK